MLLTGNSYSNLLFVDDKLAGRIRFSRPAINNPRSRPLEQVALELEVPSSSIWLAAAEDR